jgi:hypothetical protein
VKPAASDFSTDPETHANLVLLDEAETGLRELLAGKRVSADELMSALADQ